MSNATIKPIDTGQQQRVIEQTTYYIDRAGEIFAKTFPVIPVMFDLTGRAAGMYRVDLRQRRIRYNPYLFAKYFDDNLAVTVPHEVAHYITDCLYGMRNVRPHGPQWQAVMQAFGVEAKRTCHYDLEGIPVRRQQQHAYLCGCRTYQFSSRRHNQVLRGRARYYCKSCGGELTYLSR